MRSIRSGTNLSYVFQAYRACRHDVEVVLQLEVSHPLDVNSLSEPVFIQDRDGRAVHNIDSLQVRVARLGSPSEDRYYDLIIKRTP